MDVWYKKLGYYENPFLINPMKETNDLIGQEKQLKDTIYYTQSGSLVFIQAPKGSGKTKFLRTVIKNFPGRIIYVNAAKLKKTLNVEDLLRRKNGLSGKIFGSKPRDMILIIDNVDELSKVNMERIKFYYDQGFLRSVIFSGTNFKRIDFPESMRTRIGKRIIQLDELKKSEAVRLAMDRLDESLDEDDSLIKKSQIEKIYESSRRNPRMFLINLHRIFEEMYFDEAKQVTAKHLKILEDKLDKDDVKELNKELEIEEISKEETMFDEKGHRIMKIGEYYRRPDYEMFCGNCGAIVSETDKQCPECGSVFEEEGEEADSKKAKKGEAHA